MEKLFADNGGFVENYGVGKELKHVAEVADGW